MNFKRTNIPRSPNYDEIRKIFCRICGVLSGSVSRIWYDKKKCKAALKQWNSSTQDEVADFHIQPQNSILHLQYFNTQQKVRNPAQSLIMIKKKQNAKRKEAECQASRLLLSVKKEFDAAKSSRLLLGWFLIPILLEKVIV